MSWWSMSRTAEHQQRCSQPTWSDKRWLWEAGIVVSIPSVGHKQHLGGLSLQFQPAGDALHYLLR